MLNKETHIITHFKLLYFTVVYHVHLSISKHLFSTFFLLFSSFPKMSWGYNIVIYISRKIIRCWNNYVQRLQHLRIRNHHHLKKHSALLFQPSYYSSINVMHIDRPESLILSSSSNSVLTLLDRPFSLCIFSVAKHQALPLRSKIMIRVNTLEKCNCPPQHVP